MSVFDRMSIPPSAVLANAEILVIDANPPVITLRQTALSAKSMGAKVFFEPTSVWVMMMQLCRR